MYVQLTRSDGAASGIFMRSSNAMDVSLSRQSVTWRSSGGIIDMHIFAGPAYGHVVRQYTKLVGRPHLPPFWALGFHLCRWGYMTVDKTREVVEQMRAKGIPHDVQWNDIDIYDGFRNFELNPQTFPRAKVASLIDNLHSKGQRYVMIVDAAIASQQQVGGYPARDAGLAQSVFVTSKNGAPLTGKVWPGSSFFPDFFHPNATGYWGEMLRRWRGEVDYDGVWLDMNEPSSFCDGECAPEACNEPGAVGEQCEPSPDYAETLRRRMVFAPWKLKGMGGRRFDPSHPPYVPGSAASLDQKTVSMSASHCLPEEEWGAQCSMQLHYNVHNLYGLAETRVTARVLPDIVGGKRALLISRSTFPGSGSVAGTWLGDSASTWEDMRLSIPGVLSMGMYGVPFVGADICGFFQNTTRELCVRWHQLGSMYPLSRNHNDLQSMPQEPSSWDDEAMGIMRSSLLDRYSLLAYFYTLFHQAHADGSPVARPLIMEFPGSEAVELADVDEQFMVGPALLVSPVLHEGASSVIAKFPGGRGGTRWFCLRSGRAVDAGAAGAAEVPAPLSHLPLHIRSGHVIPMQIHGTATTTAELRKMMVTWVAAFGQQYQGASGSLVMDDGESSLPSACGHMRVWARARVNSKGAVGGNITTVSKGRYDPRADPTIAADVLVGGVIMYGLTEEQYMWGETDMVLNGHPVPDMCVEEDKVAGAVRADFAKCGALTPPSVRDALSVVWKSRPPTPPLA